MNYTARELILPTVGRTDGGVIIFMMLCKMLSQGGVAGIWREFEKRIVQSWVISLLVSNSYSGKQ
jgi:hypothetical protein